MATSGSFNTSAYGSGNYNRYLRFEWSVQSQSISGNSTTISYTLKGAGGNTTSYVMSGPFKLVIDGQTVYSSSSRIQLKNGTVLKTGTFTMTHNSAGARSFSASATAAIYTAAVNCSGSGSWALPDIPRAATISKATNFNDTGNPTITYSNPAGNSVTSLNAGIFLDGWTAVADYRAISKTGTSYTFNLTEAERNAIRAAMPNSNTMTLRFYVQTVIGGQTYLNYTTATVTIVDGNPTFSAAYQDTNSTVTAITGNNQQIVRNQSTLRVSVTSLSAKKSATISSVTCTLNGTTYNGTISGTSCTFNIGTLNIASNATAAVKVTDSRGNSASKNLTIQILDWVLPSAIITMQRQNNYYDPTTINVDGSISSVNGMNAMTIKLRYKKQSDAWSSQTWYTMQDNVSQTFTMDNDFAWDVQVVISDKFGSTTYNTVNSRGLPIAYFDRLLSSVGFNCIPKDEHSVEANGVPLTRCIMTRSLSEQKTNLAVGTYTNIPLDLSNSVGSRLTAVSGGGIKVSAGVSKVLVSAKMAVEGVTVAGARHLRIIKNSYSAANTLGWAWDTLAVSDAEDIIVTPILANVSEGDIIYMDYWTQQSSDKIGGNAYGCRTSLTVEVVG